MTTLQIKMRESALLKIAELIEQRNKATDIVEIKRIEAQLFALGVMAGI